MALFIAGMKHKERGGPQWYMHVTDATLLGTQWEAQERSWEDRRIKQFY